MVRFGFLLLSSALGLSFALGSVRVLRLGHHVDVFGVIIVLGFPDLQYL